MAKAPATTDTPAEPFAPVRDGAEQLILDMLGPDLATAVVEARGRLRDASIWCRIGENPLGPDADHYPPGFVPGLVSIHRDGADTVYDLGHEDAVRMVGDLV